MTNPWDDEDNNEQFLDIPDETKLDANGQRVQSPPIQTQRPVAPSPTKQGPVGVTQNAADVGLVTPERDVDLQELGIEEDEDYTTVLNDANLRIEQGRLYQMIMNHDLFADMDVDPRAVHNVQSQIRKFARESMEVMLGMRETTPVRAIIPQPFNDLEIEILKRIASKATNGATETKEANEVAAVVKEVPKRKTLTPIGGTTALKKTPAKKIENKLPAKAANPVKRTRSDVTVDQILREEGVPKELIEEDYVGIGKPLNQLTADELTKRAKDTAIRLSKRTTVKSANALPMATPEQAELLAAQRAQQIGNAPGMAVLLDKVKSMPVKNP